MNISEDDLIMIEGYPMLDGYSEFELKDRFDLKIGDKINQIGRLTKSGRESSSCRVMKITPHMTYSGLVRIQGIEFMAFKLPEDGVSGFTAEYSKREIFSLWKVVEVKGYEPELILHNDISETIEIHKAVFNKVA